MAFMIEHKDVSVFFNLLSFDEATVDLKNFVGGCMKLRGNATCTDLIGFWDKPMSICARIEQ